jgi:hypothetical protein
MAGSRIMVEDAIADAFIDAFVARTKTLRVGDPFDAATEIGPIAFEAHNPRRAAEAAEGWRPMTKTDRRASGRPEGASAEPHGVNRDPERGSRLVLIQIELEGDEHVALLVEGQAHHLRQSQRRETEGGSFRGLVGNLARLEQAMDRLAAEDGEAGDTQPLRLLGIDVRHRLRVAYRGIVRIDHEAYAESL